MDKNTITLDWKLIPSWEALDDNKELIENNGGIYLKIWRPTNEVIYIGEAGCFADRFKTHLFHHLSGGYTTCDYELIEQNKLKSIYAFWKEFMYGKEILPMGTDGIYRDEDFRKTGGYYPENNFKSRLDKETLRKSIYFTRNIYLAVASLPELRNDSKRRKEIESYLQLQIWKKTSLALGYNESDFKSECKIKIARGSSPFGKIEKSNILNNCPFKIAHLGDEKIGKQFT